MWLLLVVVYVLVVIAVIVIVIEVVNWNCHLKQCCYNYLQMIITVIYLRPYKCLFF